MCTNILALSTFSISEQASLSFLSLHMIFLTAYWGKKKDPKPVFRNEAPNFAPSH